MATSNATPEDAPDEPVSARPEGVDATSAAIAAIIDPLTENARQMSAIHAERARLLAELHRLGQQPRIIAGLRGDPVETGADDPDTQAHGPAWGDVELAERTLATEVAGALRLHSTTARMMIFNAAHLVEKLPGFQKALAQGRISWAHVLRMQDVVTGAPAEVLPALEAAVLPKAEKLTATQFGRVAARELERLHPVSLQERADVGASLRRVVLQPDVDGMAWLNAYLKADEAQAGYDRLTRIAKSLNDADTTDQPADGAEGGGEVVLRTMDQRRADAFRDLLLDGECAGGMGRGIRGTVHVTVPVLTLMGKSFEPGMLEGYGPIDPETARRLAGTAPSWDRILTHPETGCMLSVGRDSYSPPTDMKRYTEIRDQTCQGIGCNRKATHSEIDHTVPWNKGGPTAVGNLVHLCKACHRLKHQSSFSTRQTPTGALTWTSPGGKTYTREPANPIGGTSVRTEVSPPQQPTTVEKRPAEVPNPTPPPEIDSAPPF
ncbi:HNH endonuclease signature motif containing protein [Cryobacterium arcticum]|uniref:HNH nuclease domain-containing protein n=1 Tax=Cryobacterium arcticum TaxID=670052 RepID=A0A317ZXJ3_9MICO|nr:HNH endonuclease signature motif containing protein [Cryobacterium arcticum]PXA70580.1 hypothetical protein CTB96_05655 [Cryobacterium arcticum]